MQVLYTVLLIYVLALSLEFLAGLTALWYKHGSPQPQPSVSYFTEVDGAIASQLHDELVVQQTETQAETFVETVMPQVQHLPGTVSELRKLAQKRHIKGARSMKKAQLVEALLQ